MKKMALCLMATCLSLTFYPLLSNAANTTASSAPVALKPSESEKAKSLLLRLNEIKEMDKSNLKPSDKKNLRKEVRSTKQQLKELGGGVYLSVGAIIIIVLLLILLV